MDDYANYLHKLTGHKWEPLLPLQLRFKLVQAGNRFLCVVTPKTPQEQSFCLIDPEYYIPTNEYGIFEPHHFIEKYLLLRQALLYTLPAIKVDASKFKPIELIPASFDNYLILVTLQPTGDFILANLKSSNKNIYSSSSLRTIQLTSNVELGRILSTFKVIACNPLEQKLTIQCNLSSDCWTVDYSAVLGDPILISGIANPKSVKIQLGNWELKGQLGLNLKGTIYKSPNSPSLNTNDNKFHTRSNLSTKLLPTIILTGGLIAFSILIA